MMPIRLKPILLMLTLAILLLSLGPIHALDKITVEVVFWNWGPDAVETHKQIAEGFMALHPDIIVKPVPVDGTNWGTYLDGMATLIAGGEKPDTVLVASEGVRLLVQKLKIVMPLDDFIAKDKAKIQLDLDDVAKPMLDALNIDGHQYMLPFSWNNMVMYFNTARLKEANLTLPPANWTRDDFLKYAKALTVTNNGKTEKYGYAWDNSGMFISALPWIFANGTDILTDDYCKPQVTNPKVEEALQFMHDLIYVYKVSPAPTAYGDIYNLFQNGSIAMFGAGRWSLTALLPANFKDFDIQYFPGNPDRRTIFGLGGYPILTTSQHPDAAWELVKYLASVDVQKGLLGTATAPFSNIPARRSVAKGMVDFPPNNSKIFYDSLDGDSSLKGQFARMVTAPPRFSEMENIFLRYTGQIFADEMSVSDAMNAAQKELESVVACS
jgi:multiple sugar transport system substrate-binding protein